MLARTPIRLLTAIVAVILISTVSAQAAGPSGPNGTVALYQASGTPSPPADGDSPFTSCDVSGFSGGETSYVNSEVSPWVAVNPTDPSNIIGVYQQDQFSLGGGRGLVAAVSHDGGQTWSATFPPFSSCAGGDTANGGDYQRAREPKMAFSPDGDAYFASRLGSPIGNGPTAIRVSKSTDGGDHWGQPVTLVRYEHSVAPFYLNTRESIATDPFDSNYVYVVWQRSRKPGDSQSAEATHSFAFRGDLMFSRTIDGGRTWEEPRAIVMYRDNSGTFANRLRVLPDGTLVVAFDNVQGAGCVQSGATGHGCDIKLVRSTDRGQTWSSPIDVAPERAVPPFDPDTGAPIRVDLGRPDVAVDSDPSSPGYGNLYAVWADSFGSSKKTPYSTVVFTESTDGGLTWSPLVKVNGSPAGVQAILPAVDVASDGTVAVTYYDFRNNTPDPGVPTDLWMVHCQAGSDCTRSANWSENHVAGSFDIERAPNVRGYYLGDYTGLTSIGTSFLPFFTQTTPADRANAYLGVVTP